MIIKREGDNFRSDYSNKINAHVFFFLQEYPIFFKSLSAMSIYWMSQMTLDDKYVDWP